MMIQIPVGCISEIWIPIKNPNCEIKEGGVTIWQNGDTFEELSDLEYKEAKENYVIFEIGSGYYQLSIIPYE